MQYIRVEGDSLNEIRDKLIYKYGEDIYIIKVDTKKGGLLKKKKNYIVTAGIPDDIYYERSKKEILKNKAINDNDTLVSDGASVTVSVQERETSQINQDVLKVIEQKLDTLLVNNASKEQSILEHYIESLSELEFDKVFRKDLYDYLQKNLNVQESKNIEDIRKKAIEFIESTIMIDADKIGKNDIAVLVGPTGVGKTTTIVKLATNFKIYRSMTVKLLTADQTKLGGTAHLSIAANILKVPFATIYKKEDFIENLMEEQDVILIDTPGTSQRDNQTLASIKDRIEVKKKNLKVFLTISATTKYTDLLDIMERFKFLGYTNIIITKVDETNAIGSVLSALYKYKMPISYVTNGQDMTKNLLEADKDFFIKMAFGEAL